MLRKFFAGLLAAVCAVLVFAAASPAAAPVSAIQSFQATPFGTVGVSNCVFKTTTTLTRHNSGGTLLVQLYVGTTNLGGGTFVSTKGLTTAADVNVPSDNMVAGTYHFKMTLQNRKDAVRDVENSSTFSPPSGGCPSQSSTVIASYTRSS